MLKKNRINIYLETRLKLLKNVIEQYKYIYIFIWDEQREKQRLEYNWGFIYLKKKYSSFTRAQDKIKEKEFIFFQK